MYVDVSVEFNRSELAMLEVALQVYVSQIEDSQVPYPPGWYGRGNTHDSLLKEVREMLLKVSHTLNKENERIKTEAAEKEAKKVASANS